MNIDKALIEHVAAVARLELTEKEIEKFLPQLKEILEAFAKIDEIDTKNVKPSFQPVHLENFFREDKPGQCLTQDQALAHTKHKKDGFFKGPSAV